MAARRRTPPRAFLYEPNEPPTIPPGMTIADYRRRRAGRARRTPRRRLRR